MKNKIELIPVNEFGSEITIGGYSFDKFIEKPKQLTDLEIAIKLEEIEREETKQETVEEVMTPKEEAENLVNSFLKDKKFQFGFREVRKECALIAVDEIIIALNFHQWQNTKQIDYYIEVRQEIENL
jgi:hypothetical protein